MLKIHLSTGTAWTKAILVDGYPQGDLMEYIDDYYSKHGLPVTLYHLNDLDLEDLEEVIPINGGEYYIEGISHVDEIRHVRLLQDLRNTRLKFHLAKGDICPVSLCDSNTAKLSINNGQFEVPIDDEGETFEFMVEG